MKRCSIQVGVNTSGHQHTPTFVMVAHSFQNGEYCHDSNDINKSQRNEGDERGNDESVCIGKWHGCILHNSFKQDDQRVSRGADSLLASLIKQIHPYNRHPLKDGEGCNEYSILNRVSEVSIHAVSTDIDGNNSDDNASPYSDIIATWDVDCSTCDGNVDSLSLYNRSNMKKMKIYERHIESCPALIRIPPSLFNDPDDDEDDGETSFRWFSLIIDFTLEQGGEGDGDGDGEDEVILCNTLLEQCHSLIDVIFFNRYNPSNTNAKYSNIWSDAQTKTSRLDSSIIRSALVSQHWKWNTLFNNISGGSTVDTKCSDMCCLDAVKLISSIKLDMLPLWPSHIDSHISDNNDTVEHLHTSQARPSGKRGVGGRQTYTLPSAIDFSSNVASTAHHPTTTRRKQKKTPSASATAASGLTLQTSSTKVAKNMKKRGRAEVIADEDDVEDELDVSGSAPSKIAKITSVVHADNVEDAEVEEEEEEEVDELEEEEEEEDVEEVEDVEDDENEEDEGKDAFMIEEDGPDGLILLEGDDDEMIEDIEETPYDIDNDDGDNFDAHESSEDEVIAAPPKTTSRYSGRSLSRSSVTKPTPTSRKTNNKKSKKTI